MAGRDLFANPGRDLFASESMPDAVPAQPPKPLSIKDRIMQRSEEIKAGFKAQQELVKSVGSSALLEPVAGVMGLAQSLNPYAQPGEGARTVENIRGYAYQPETQKGKQLMRGVGEKLEPIAKMVTEPLDYIADYGYETTGSPLVGTALKILPAALLEYLGLKGFSKARSGERLLSSDGRPTKALEKVLDKDGLTFDGLTPEAKSVIGEFSEPKLLPSPKSERNIVGQNVQAKQIATGGRENALAPYKLDGNDVIPDRLATEAIDQGWKDGTVQMVKTSNKSTREVMDEMIDMRWQLLRDDSNATKLYPMNAVGDVFNERIQFITMKAKKARANLDNIAETKLKGVYLDATPVVDHLKTMLDELQITNKNPDPLGIPHLEYRGSVIQADKSAQKVINLAIDLMATGGKPDAYRFHILKRQLDSLIDFKKKSKGGLTEKGRNVLKGLRAKVNDQLRLSFDDYAATNDVLSSVLGAMDEFKTAFKIDRDLFTDPSDVIGNEMRKVHTKYKAGHLINQNITNIDKLANDLGGDFNVNYEDLIQFANRMDEVFGSSKSGDFRGVTEAASSYVTDGTHGLLRRGVDLSKDINAKIRGRNEFGQYHSMKELLNVP